MQEEFPCCRCLRERLKPQGAGFSATSVSSAPLPCGTPADSQSATREAWKGRSEQQFVVYAHTLLTMNCQSVRQGLATLSCRYSMFDAKWCSPSSCRPSDGSIPIPLEAELSNEPLRQSFLHKGLADDLSGAYALSVPEASNARFVCCQVDIYTFQEFSSRVDRVAHLVS